MTLRIFCLHNNIIRYEQLQSIYSLSSPQHLKKFSLCSINQNDFQCLVFFIVLKTSCQDTSGIGHLGSGHCWGMDLQSVEFSISQGSALSSCQPRDTGQDRCPFPASLCSWIALDCLSLARGCRWLLINQRVGMELPHCTTCCRSIKPHVPSTRGIPVTKGRSKEIFPGQKNPEFVVHN